MPLWSGVIVGTEHAIAEEEETESTSLSLATVLRRHDVGLCRGDTLGGVLLADDD